jgi:alkanesulfonate monooxygenase SsuD/methylene tetrahydromethanopterin reductase-like flavin-dependent oxidoreductase (luciferase family)
VTIGEEVRCAVGVPNAEATGDPAVLLDLAQRAEAAGWDGFFLWDHLQYRDTGWPAVDPWVVLGAIAQATETIKLGVMVTPLSRRRPAKVARETATLDRLSGGRFVFGAGLGSKPEHEFVPFGDEGEARTRADMLDEGLEILAGLWSGEPFAHHGEHYTVEETAFTPTPVQRPRIPVWIAGRWPAKRPLRRAARWDGVFPIDDTAPEGGPMRPERLREIVDYVLAHRESGGPFDVAIEGPSEPDEPILEAYAQAGLTWWVERLSWNRGPLQARVARIDAGPPS